MTDNSFREPRMRAAAPHEAPIPPQKYLIIFVGALIGFGPASIDMYLPSFLEVSRELGTSYDNVQLTLSTFLVGFAAGQLVIGPLSDRFGRRPLLIIGIGLYTVASFMCALTPGILALIGARLLQALGGCTGTVIARAILRDVYSGNALARSISLMMLVAAVAPLLAPMIGSYVLEWAGWRAIFAVLTAFGLACLAATLFYYRETLGPAQRTPLNLRASLRGYAEMMVNRQAFGYVLTGGMAFAMLFAYISGAPGVFIDHFGLSPRGFAFVFGANVVGLALGNIVNSRLVERIGADRLLGVGTGLALSGTLALILLGWTGILGLPGFIVVLWITISAVHTIFTNSMSGLLEHYPSLAGTASALFGAAQFGFGAVSGTLVGQFYTGGPQSMVTVMAIVALMSYLAQRFMARG